MQLQVTFICGQSYPLIAFVLVSINIFCPHHNLLWLPHNWSSIGTKPTKFFYEKKNYPNSLNVTLFWIQPTSQTPGLYVTRSQLRDQKSWSKTDPEKAHPPEMDLNSSNNSGVPITWFTKQSTWSQKPRIKILALLFVLRQIQQHHSFLHLKKIR